MIVSGTNPVTFVLKLVQGKGYGPKCDVWSLGVVFFMMLTGEVILFLKSHTKLHRGTRFCHVSMLHAINHNNNDNTNLDIQIQRYTMYKFR